MKTLSDNRIKAIKAQMKAMSELLKSVKEDDIVLDNARNNYTYDQALSRNRERAFDMIRTLNEMAQEVAGIYNLHTATCETWMEANTLYTLDKA